MLQSPVIRSDHLLWNKWSIAGFCSCPVDEKLIAKFQGTWAQRDSMYETVIYAHMKTFRFTGTPALYIECDIRMCHGKCPVSSVNIFCLFVMSSLVFYLMSPTLISLLVNLMSELPVFGRLILSTLLKLHNFNSTNAIDIHLNLKISHKSWCAWERKQMIIVCYQYSKYQKIVLIRNYVFLNKCFFNTLN